MMKQPINVLLISTYFFNGVMTTGTITSTNSETSETGLSEVSTTTSTGYNQIVNGIVKARFTQFTEWEATAKSSDLSEFSEFTQSFGSLVNDIYVDFYNDVSKIRTNTDSMASASSEVISKFNAISTEKDYASKISEFVKKAKITLETASSSTSSDSSSSSNDGASNNSIYISYSVIMTLLTCLTVLL